jgi:hypothetical protein
MSGTDSDIDNPGGTIRTLASPTPATATSARPPGEEKRAMKSATRFSLLEGHLQPEHVHMLV